MSGAGDSGAAASGPIAKSAEAAPGTQSQRAQRLSVFPAARIASVAEELRDDLPRAWPRLEGVLAIIFASRSGSTFLARELQRAFQIGPMREALNPVWLVGRPPDRVLRDARNGWFGFKAGGPGVVAGELAGFFDAYLNRTRFLRLLRRDIVAQAVSRDRAVQTGRYTARQMEAKPAVYDAAGIAHGVRAIESANATLADWLARTGRPVATVFYEDFSNGDVNSALAAAESLDAPRRAWSRAALPVVERMGDAQNLNWTERFGGDADADTRDCIRRHAALVSDLEEANCGGPGPSAR